MTHLDEIKQLNEAGKAIAGLIRIIEYMGLEKFLEVYHGESLPKHQHNDLKSKADSVLEQFNKL